MPRVQKGVIVLDPLVKDEGKRRVVLPHLKEIILSLNELIPNAATLELEDSRPDISNMITGLQASRTDIQELITALKALKDHL